MITVPIRTERLEIVPVQKEAFPLFSNDELMWLYMRSIGWTEERFLEKLADWKTGYSIKFKAKVVGHLEIVPGKKESEVAIVVDYNHQRKGIAKEALNAILPKLGKVIVVVSKLNRAAQLLFLRYDNVTVYFEDEL